MCRHHRIHQVSPCQHQPHTTSIGYFYLRIPLHPGALQNFEEAHEWSFSALTKVFVAAKGGIAWSQDPQKIFTVELVPVTTLPGIRERNPSRTFRVKSFYSTAVHDHVAANPLGAMDEWVKQEPLRQAAFETYGEDPYYAGLLPLNLGIQGVNVTFMQYIPQFWPVPPSRAMPQLASDEAKKILMQDVAALAYCTINEGIPLRATGPEPPGVGFAYPGRFVRGQTRSASWSWSGLFSNWEEYRRGVHRRFDDLLDMARLRSSPPELMLALDSL